jgi:hypothetical protein
MGSQSYRILHGPLGVLYLYHSFSTTRTMELMAFQTPHISYKPGYQFALVIGCLVRTHISHLEIWGSVLMNAGKY